MNNNNQKNEKRVELIEFRNILIQSSFVISDNFINRIFWFSATVIGFSVLLFNTNFLQIELISCFILLLLSWLFLVCAVFSGIITYIFSQKATFAGLKGVDKDLEDEDGKKYYDEMPKWNNWVKNTQIGAFGFLCLGVLFFGIFLITNLNL